MSDNIFVVDQNVLTTTGKEAQNKIIYTYLQGGIYGFFNRR